MRPSFVEITSQLLQVMRTMPSVQVSSPKTPPRDPPFPPFFLYSNLNNNNNINLNNNKPQPQPQPQTLVTSESTEDISPFASPVPTPNSSSLSITPPSSNTATTDLRRSASETDKVQISHSMFI